MFTDVTKVMAPAQEASGIKKVEVVAPGECDQPQVDAKFLKVKGERFYIRGTSYGSFAQSRPGVPFPHPSLVQRDFTLMCNIGINAVRLYDLPPPWLLDMAQEIGLYVLLGIPWAQHLCLDQVGRREVIQQIYTACRQYAGHPAVLLTCVGNEIPSLIVRWYGKKQMERFISDMCAEAHDAVPGSLVTYANYPTTEYLELPCLDVVGFNVYLHEQQALQKYLAHLHVLAGDRPLLISELGMDSLKHGERAQADFFRTQLRDTFDHGACGVVTFSWTDDWFRGGEPITDWAFGLVDQQRIPKQAYHAVDEALTKTPFDLERHWPRVSVVVAAYNASSTLDDCLSSMTRLAYPDYEVIVVNDGSTDETAAIADRYALEFSCIRVIHTPNAGLSVARNVGLEAGCGQIVAYTDSDCRVEPNWLHYLALSLLDKGVAGVGGPNLIPPDDDPVAQCVGKAPGNPLHILLDDEIAEHIPGCNMAFWRDVLEEVGGFHTDFRVAGDDVDICWRLQAMGHQIGFAPAAIVWHHRRSSIRAYLKQQVGYGHSEAILEDHHPDKFNHVGQVRWFGSIYGSSFALPLMQQYRIYYGKFGSAPFQTLQRKAPSWWLYLPQMPEWYLLVLLLSIAALGLPWLGGVVLVALSFTIFSAIASGRAAGQLNGLTSSEQFRYQGLVALLHLSQPFARTWGRLRGGLGPFRLPTRAGSRNMPERASWYHVWAAMRSSGSFKAAFWSETGLERENFLDKVLTDLYRRRLNVTTGSGWEPWDLLVLGYTGERALIDSTVEYHGGPRCLLRLRSKSQVPRRMLFAGLVFALLAIRVLMYEVRGIPALDLADEVLEGVTLLLPVLWLLWLGIGRVRLTSEIMSAIDQVAQEMNLIPLKK